MLSHFLFLLAHTWQFGCLLLQALLLIWYSLFFTIHCVSSLFRYIYNQFPLSCFLLIYSPFGATTLASFLVLPLCSKLVFFKKSFSGTPIQLSPLLCAFFRTSSNLQEFAQDLYCLSFSELNCHQCSQFYQFLPQQQLAKLVKANPSVVTYSTSKSTLTQHLNSKHVMDFIYINLSD